MNTADALYKRISIRAFKEIPVDAETVRGLLDKARWSPSGGNMQPWKVIVVAGEEKAACSALAGEVLANNPRGEAGDYPIYPETVEEPYRSRRFKVGEDMYEKLGIAREDKAGRFARLAENYNFFGAPVGLFFVIDRCMGHGQWAHMGMFMQSLALVAVEEGYGTCMQEAWGMVRESLHKKFELPDNEVVYCGMALGVPDMDHTVNTLRSERAPVDEFARFKGF